MWFQWNKFSGIKNLSYSKMNIDIFVILSMTITPILAFSRNRDIEPEMAITDPLSMKNLSRRGLHSHTVKAIIEQSQICDIFASKMKSKSSLAIIKSRFPVFFTQCQLKMPFSIKSRESKCKRFGWKGRSLHCWAALYKPFLYVC